MEPLDGCASLGPSSAIGFTGDAGVVAELVAADLSAATGLELSVSEGEGGRVDLQLRLEPTRESELGSEGYELAVDDTGVSITAASEAGLFYGSRTLLQLLPAASEALAEGVVVPAVRVVDRPRFGWRGAMLDVARHFFGPDDVRGLIARMADYKLNRLHLHLTDDQGWRIEVTSWPDLATIGGSTEVGGGDGGWFTQEEYRSLVAYAESRFVVVVPEIDMPGHTNAALASYPELNPDGVAPDLYTGTDVGFSSLWLEGEATSRFVEDVLGEVASMTTGPWLHVGGDEAAATDPDTYREFIAELQDVVDDAGKVMVGWEEIGAAELAEPYVAQHWRRPEAAAVAVDGGARVIASPATEAYLDMMYDLDSPVGTLWAGLTDTRDAYEWEPVLEALVEDDFEGVEAPLWTESTGTWDEAEYLIFPRLLGHAEVGWTAQSRRRWDEYRLRLAAHGPRLDAQGIAFYRSPLVDWLP